MKTIEVEEIKALDIKDKILVIKSEDLNRHMVESFRKNLMEKGCLGIIGLTPEYDIESLGLEQLEAIVKQIKERQAHEKAQKKS